MKYEFVDLSLNIGCVKGGISEGCKNCCALRTVRRTSGMRLKTGERSRLALISDQALTKDHKSFNGKLIPNPYWRSKLNSTKRSIPKKYMCSYQTEIALSTPDQLAELLIEIYNHPKDDFYFLSKLPSVLYNKLLISKSIIGIDINKLNNIHAATSIEMDKYKFRMDDLRKFKIFGIDLLVFLKPLIGVIKNPNFKDISIIKLAPEKGCRGNILRPCNTEWIQYIKEQAKLQGIKFKLDK